MCSTDCITLKNTHTQCKCQLISLFLGGGCATQLSLASSTVCIFILQSILRKILIQVLLYGMLCLPHCMQSREPSLPRRDSVPRVSALLFWD